MSYTKRFQHNHTDVYQKVTDYVIASLKKGLVPWQQYWCSSDLPRNVFNGQVYREWNAFFLNGVTQTYQYKTPLFLTFNQALSLGDNINKGEKGFPVIYWAKIENIYKAIKADSKQEQEKTYSWSRIIPQMDIVFNIDQVKNISFTLTQRTSKTYDEKIKDCENIIEQMPMCPPIRHNATGTFYNSPLDFIQMTLPNQFQNAEYYYHTLFHELARSTGHHSRLNRKELLDRDANPKQVHSIEQLTAELAASLLCASASIETKSLNNEATYIDHWLHILRNDKTLILKASNQAQAAADYILNNPSGHNEPYKAKSEGVIVSDTQAIHA